MNDQAIIQLIEKQQYHTAIKKLYGYFPVIKKHILKNSGSKQEAEDVFQDSLVILINRIRNGEFELNSSINTYLFSVAKFQWLAELRKKNKMQEAFIDFNEGAEEVDIQSHIEEDNRIKTAQHAVEQIGDKCKQLLELFYFNKKSMIEIAQQLGFKTEKVAKNQKYRCIEKVKEILRNN